ncbi:hypothetical protein, partial [Streptomyces acidiscabies]|uniref:hypothetical protein n=1 Tax=Streptomyces acidiscabies TaxID=42234 RepID=UPI0038F6CAED
MLSIVYEDRRNQLKNLEGAQQEVIRSAFLHHVHAGGSDHPSKIKLDTQVILTAFGPPGSPIFELLDSNGNPFS